MTDTTAEPLDPGEVNTRPGPVDRGGHGGMATREQEAREADAAEDSAESTGTDEQR